MCRLLSVTPVCKSWYSACLTCPELWERQEFLLVVDSEGVQRLERFARWLARRAQHVRALHMSCMAPGLHDAEEELQRQVGMGT